MNKLTKRQDYLSVAEPKGDRWLTAPFIHPLVRSKHRGCLEHSFTKDADEHSAACFESHQWLCQVQTFEECIWHMRWRALFPYCTSRMTGSLIQLNQGTCDALFSREDDSFVWRKSTFRSSPHVGYGLANLYIHIPPTNHLDAWSTKFAVVYPWLLIVFPIYLDIRIELIKHKINGWFLT